jgi:hypothetical protein
MISYEDAKTRAQQELGIDTGEPVQRILKWVAYKNGAVVGQSYVSREDAEKQFKTLITEKIVENQDAVDQYHKALSSVDQRASEIWYASLRNEYPDLSTEVFNLCYEQAYSDGHAYGHDEVANCMISVVEFAEKILKDKQ